MSRLSQREKDEMLAAYRRGETSVAIGALYGVHPAYVRKLAARHGYSKQAIPSTPRRPRPRKKHLPKPGIDPRATGSGRHQVAGYTKLM